MIPTIGREEFLRRLGGELASAGVTLLEYRNKTGSDAELLAERRFPSRGCVRRVGYVGVPWQFGACNHHGCRDGQFVEFTKCLAPATALQHQHRHTVVALRR